MNSIKNKMMIGATTFFIVTTVGLGMVQLQVKAYADTIQSSKQYRNYYINNVQQSELYCVDGETFVPGAETAKYFSLDYNDSVEGTITIKNNGNEYVFEKFVNYYTKNGEKVYIKVTEQNGVKTPDTYTITKNNNNHLFIPLSFFEKELGLKFEVDSSNNLYLGDVPNNATSDGSFDTDPTGDGKAPTHYSTANSKLSIDEGWVAPTLKSTSVDDLKKDAQTLIKELEFVPNGIKEDGSTTSAKFDIMGMDGRMSSMNVTCVGPVATGPDASHFNSIMFNSYNTTPEDYRGISDNMAGYYGKMSKIDPQVLKFYYPNSWEWLNTKLLYLRDNASSSNIITERYTIDGRDTVINGNGQITVYMSKVGGSLKGQMLTVPYKGTIGEPYSFGYWAQSNGNWYFEDNLGNAQKGWIQDKGHYYYLDPSTGAMKTGWIKDGGNWYYCWSNGQMATDTAVDGYTLNSNGALIS
ncbi:stalk domain-containing protein [Clostridium beijerinckii]|uniref:Putative cell wall binding repeat protein n=1 Tax=Clostridium beijerinckii TaxID=1520 RepID=A0A1S8S1I2_CLOBE|nr:stalk domain-containing protein [Clostridium beijerinckii]NRY60672.1 hypothetical protein [Clostridium beijerinckii]OOM59291.1 putative cell wall binding repeat protein [Clostridium beijerinckii]